MNSQLAKRWCNLDLPLKVCHSAAGYYIGSWDAEGPVSRDSEEYYRTEQLAQAALDNNTFTQRAHP